MGKEYREKNIFGLVETNGIYAYHDIGGLDIFWVGSRYSDCNAFLDKQYSGQLYGLDSLPKNYKKITLREAVKKDLIKHRRFELMNPSDKTDTIKIMLEEKGIIPTLNFIAAAELNISEQDIRDILK